MAMLASADKRLKQAPCKQDAAGWVGLLATPTFAVMAWVTATGGAVMAHSLPGVGTMSVNEMALMYLLMSVFHLPPWLRLASRHR